MSITTLSSREFSRDIRRAKKAASTGPVFITHHGRPAHVLLTIEDYQRLVGGGRNVIDMLAAPGTEDVEFTPPKAGVAIQPADLS